MAAYIVSSWVPPSLPECAAPTAPGLVLLERWCYVADLPNTTTAESTTSTGFPIKVTFRAARPPHPSHFCVHCPGLHSRSRPKIVATDADLVLLCVPVNPYSTSSVSDWDYFVYRPRAQWLSLIPNPHPTIRGLHDSATALISRDSGASYAVAALGVRPPLYDGDAPVRWDFDLHLYRSSPDSPKGRWITKRLSLTEFQRDKLIPLPPALDSRLHHETEKTITIGGEHGTVAWVDLWRGVFVCDVLRKRPVLRDVPLPVPARANWDRLLRVSDPRYVRDVTISRNKGLIKYVELEFRSREVELISNDAAAPDDVSYIDWVSNLSRRKKKYLVIYDGWKSTVWNMKIPGVGSSKGCWHRDCVVDVKDVVLDEAGEPRLSDLMAELSSKTTRTLEQLPVGYPTLSMDDDVLYLCSMPRPKNMDDNLAVMFAIDARKATLQGLAELDTQKRTTFLPDIFTSEICTSVPDEQHSVGRSKALKRAEK